MNLGEQRSSRWPGTTSARGLKVGRLLREQNIGEFDSHRADSRGARRLVTAPVLQTGEKSSILLPRTARVAQWQRQRLLNPAQCRFESGGAHRTAEARWPAGPYKPSGRVRLAVGGRNGAGWSGDLRPLIRVATVFESRQLHPMQDEPASEGASATSSNRWERYPDPALRNVTRFFGARSRRENPIYQCARGETADALRSDRSDREVVQVQFLPCALRRCGEIANAQR